MSLRDTVWKFAARANPFVGTAKTVADEIERWFVDGASDGFNFSVTAPSEFAVFVDQVVPLLQRRGLFRTEYAHDTLRGHLGLHSRKIATPRRANKWRSPQNEEGRVSDPYFKIERRKIRLAAID